MSEKPVIFISHSSKDSERTNVLKKQIETALSNVDVFVTSHPDAIPVSKEWFVEIVERLEAAQALVVIVSPASKVSCWVNFEIGYFWKINEDRERYGKAKLPIYPLSHGNEPLFGVLTSIQGKSLVKLHNKQFEGEIVIWFFPQKPNYEG